MSSNSLQVKNIIKRFKAPDKSAFTAVNDVSFELVQGEAFALLGESGCGKTTLLRCIAGLEAPDEGGLFLNSENLSDKPVHLRNIGMVFQDYAVFPHMNVSKNICYGIKNSADRDTILQGMLKLFKIEDQKDKMPSQLSGGQLQRVAIARTLAANPALVLLDEPFSNLDKKLAIELRSEIRAALKKENLPSILVTHDQQEAFAFADRVAIMKEGIILQIDSPENLYLNPLSKEVAEFLGNCQFISGKSDGSSVLTAIGEIPVSNSIDGNVEVLLRPENIEIVEDEKGTFKISNENFLGGARVLTVTDGEVSLQVQVSSYKILNSNSNYKLSAIHQVPVFR